MTPDKQPFQDWPIAGLLLMAVTDAWKELSHKSVLAIAGAVITILTYWGFSTTLERLTRIENKQDVEVVERHKSMETINDRMFRQDICITGIQERQNHVIQSLDELKSTHRDKK